MKQGGRQFRPPLREMIDTAPPVHSAEWRGSGTGAQEVE